MFRYLKENEIDCRVQSINEKGFSILLYKDARCDMNILDETVGAMNWKREHTRDNANCIVSIWDKEKEQWISKEDTGTESFTEKEKGLASDSFKRACFNWGIGRELYTAPFIWIKPIEDKEIFNKNGRHITYTKIIVSKIVIEDQKITYLELKDNKGRVRFTFGSFKARNKATQNTEKTLRERVLKICEGKKQNLELVAKILNGNKLESIIDKKEQDDFLLVLAKQISIQKR